jgi:hypothetical protein
MGAILLWLAWRRGWLKRPGALTGMFFVIYGLSRFAVEFVRQPDAQFAGPGNPVGYALQLSPSIGLTMGQILTLPMIALGLWLILRSAQDRDMTDLKTRLIERISRHGPMTLAEYMTECLLHPDLGYYTRKDPLGRAGDFITAPEISQMFGELIGLWRRRSGWTRARPATRSCWRLGPGRGTLMADALRATRGVPGFHAAMACTSSRPRRICARFSDNPRPAHPDLPRHARHRPGASRLRHRQRVLRRAADPAVPARRGRVLARTRGRASTGRSPSASPRRHRSPRSSPASPIRNRA